MSPGFPDPSSPILIRQLDAVRQEVGSNQIVQDSFRHDQGLFFGLYKIARDCPILRKEVGKDSGLSFMFCSGCSGIVCVRFVPVRY